MIPSNSAQIPDQFDQGALRLNAKADEAVETVRNAASDTLSTLQTKVDEMADRIPPAVAHTTAKLSGVARRGIERATETTSKIRTRVENAGESTSGYVRAKPIQSVAIAAGAGAAIALVLNWALGARSPRH